MKLKELQATITPAKETFKLRDLEAELATPTPAPTPTPTPKPTVRLKELEIPTIPSPTPEKPTFKLKEIAESALFPYKKLIPKIPTREQMGRLAEAIYTPKKMSKQGWSEIRDLMVNVASKPDEDWPVFDAIKFMAPKDKTSMWYHFAKNLPETVTEFEKEFAGKFTETIGDFGANALDPAFWGLYALTWYGAPVAAKAVGKFGEATGKVVVKKINDFLFQIDKALGKRFREGFVKKISQAKTLAEKKDIYAKGLAKVIEKGEIHPRYAPESAVRVKQIVQGVTRSLGKVKVSPQEIQSAQQQLRELESIRKTIPTTQMAEFGQVETAINTVKDIIAAASAKITEKAKEYAKAIEEIAEEKLIKKPIPTVKEPEKIEAELFEFFESKAPPKIEEKKKIDKKRVIPTKETVKGFAKTLRDEKVKEYQEFKPTTLPYKIRAGGKVNPGDWRNRSEWKAIDEKVRRLISTTKTEAKGIDEWAQSLGYDSDRLLIEALQDFDVTQIAKPTETISAYMEEAQYMLESPEGQEMMRVGKIDTAELVKFIRRRQEVLAQVDQETPIIQPIKGQRFPVIQTTPHTPQVREFVADTIPIHRMGGKWQMIHPILRAFHVKPDIQTISDKAIDKLKELEINNVVDVFAGSGFGAVLMQKLFPGASVRMNELDDDLQKFWRVVQEDAEGVKNALNIFRTYIHLASTPTKWPKELREKFSGFAEDTTWAAAYALEYNQAVSGRNIKKISQKKINDVIRSIDTYKRKIGRMDITKEDAAGVIKEYIEKGTKNDFLFIDPPYVWSTGYKYGADYERPAGFINLIRDLKLLHRKGVKFMFFNNDPVHQFPAVADNINNYTALNNMLDELNKLTKAGITVIRGVQPIGTRRKEIIITNLPTGKYATTKYGEETEKKFSDFWKEKEEFGVVKAREKIAREKVPVEEAMSKERKKYIGALAFRLGFIQNNKFLPRLRSFFERLTGKRFLGEMTKEQGETVVKALRKYEDNKKEIEGLMKKLKISPLLMNQIYKLYTDKTRLDQLEPEEVDKVLFALDQFEHTTDLPITFYFEYVEEGLGSWVKKNPHHQPLWDMWKRLESRAKDGRNWRMDIIMKFTDIFKEMNKEQREKIFAFMHRPKGMTHEEFLKEREKFGLTADQKKAALQARELWNYLFRESGLPPEKYWVDYQPLIQKSKGSFLRAYPDRKKIPQELRVFYEAERKGRLVPEERDPIELFKIYSQILMKKKFIHPTLVDIQKYIPALPERARLVFEMLINDEFGYRSKIEKTLDSHLESITRKILNLFEKKGINLEKTLNFLGLPTQGRMLEGMLAFARDMIYASGLGRPGAWFKNLTQEIHSMAEWATWWLKALPVSKTARGKKITQRGDIFTLGVPIKYSKGMGLVGAVSDIATWAFRNKDRGSREKAYLAGILAAEKYTRQYNAGKINEQQLMNILRFNLANSAQQEWARLVIKSKPEAYDQKHMEMLTEAIRKEIQERRTAGRKIEAKELYLGHLSGYFSQARVQYPYYGQQTEPIYRGTAGKTIGIFGTWPLRFLVMMKRWIQAGPAGWATLLRYLAIWSIADIVGDQVGLNPRRWIGALSISPEPFLSSLRTLLGVPYNIFGCLVYLVHYAVKGDDYSKRKARNKWIQAKRQHQIHYPAGVWIGELYTAFANPYLSTKERIFVAAGLPADKNTRRKIKEWRREKRR